MHDPSSCGFTGSFTARQSALWLVMGFYNDTIIAHLTALSMRGQWFREQRENIIPLAKGHVLELGIGSGLNLPYYAPEVTVQGVEPSAVMRAKAVRAASELGRTLEFAGLDGAEIALENNTVDTVVSTWVLCSIPDVEQALSEVRRVLKPGGRFLFNEHGLAPEGAVAKWQNRLNRPWRAVTGGCNINRRHDKLIEAAGFSFDNLQCGFEQGPKLVSYSYKGVAQPR